jgi:hypothetical protein
VAKSTFASSVTSILAMGAANLATTMFMSMFGWPSAQSLTQSVQTAFWARAPPPQQQPHQQPSKEEDAKQTQRWDAMRAMGSAREAVDTLSRHSTAVMLLLLSLTLQYLHVMGAYEMRRKMKARVATQSKTDGGVVTAAAGSTASDETNTKRSIAYAQAKQAVTQKKKRSADEEVVVDAESYTPDENVLESALRGLYLRDRFYNPSAPGEGGDWYLTVNTMRVNPVRIIMNVLLGFSMQLNAMFTGSSTMQAVDPVVVAARAAAVVAYWELFARALRLYGWAPVYIAVQQVTHMLMSANKTKKRRGARV